MTKQPRSPDLGCPRAEGSRHGDGPGTGKSTALAELGRRGFEVVDTDAPGWTEWRDEHGGHIWREDRIVDLLARGREVTLFVSGTVSNQGRFYSHFDAVVLLSAPAEVMLERIGTGRRTTTASTRRNAS